MAAFANGTRRIRKRSTSVIAPGVGIWLASWVVALGHVHPPSGSRSIGLERSTVSARLLPTKDLAPLNPSSARTSRICLAVVRPAFAKPIRRRSLQTCPRAIGQHEPIGSTPSIDIAPRLNGRPSAFGQAAPVGAIHAGASKTISPADYKYSLFEAGREAVDWIGRIECARSPGLHCQFEHFLQEEEFGFVFEPVRA